MLKVLRIKKTLGKGFTLIELLVVVSMVMMIGLGVYKTLASGISVYNWFLLNAPQNDAEIFLEKISYDLKNIFPGTTAVFYGTANRISFFAHNTDYMLLGPGTVSAKNTVEEPGLYSVEYHFDPENNNVVKRTYRFSDGSLKSESVVLRNVKKLNFEFCSIDSISKKLNEFVPAAGNYPAAVKVTVELDIAGKSDYIYDKIIEIPVNLP